MTASQKVEALEKALISVRVSGPTHKVFAAAKAKQHVPALMQMATTVQMAGPSGKTELEQLAALLEHAISKVSVPEEFGSDAYQAALCVVFGLRVPMGRDMPELDRRRAIASKLVDRGKSTWTRNFERPATEELAAVLLSILDPFEGKELVANQALIPTKQSLLDTALVLAGPQRLANLTSGQKQFWSPHRGMESFDIELLAAQAMNLHYAAMLRLFCIALDNRLPAPDWNSPAHRHARLLSTYLHNAYISVMYCRLDNDILMGDYELGVDWHDARQDRFAEFVGEKVAAKLARLSRVLDEATPIGPSTFQPPSCEAHHGQQQWQIYHVYALLLDFERQFTFADFTYEADDRTDVFSGLRERANEWKRWLARAESHAVSEPGEILAGASGALATSIAAGRGLRQPIQQQPRELARKAAAMCYRFAEGETVIDGQSLKQLVETFFDTHSYALIARYL